MQLPSISLNIFAPVCTNTIPTPQVHHDRDHRKQAIRKGLTRNATLIHSDTANYEFLPYVSEKSFDD